MTRVLHSFEELNDYFTEMQAEYDDVDYNELFNDWMRAFEELHNEYFQSNTGPDGVPWTSKGYDSQINVSSGRLKDSLTSTTGDSVRDITPDGIKFGTSVEYAKYLKNKVVGISDQKLDDITEELADHIIEETKE